MERNPLATVPEGAVPPDPPGAHRRRALSGASGRKMFHARALSFGSQSAGISIHQQLTPPITPNGSQESLPLLPEQKMSFLRAFFPFRPPPTENPSTVTLPLSTGDVLLVHSIHNGWADGTKLLTGERGWLPTNYCEEYEPEQLKSLLRGCLFLFDQFRVGGTTSLSDASFMCSGVVAGVKALLEATNCVTRDAVAVQSNSRVKQSRKVLLADLSTLVKSARKIPEVLSKVDSLYDAETELENVIDEVILRTFKLVVRGTKFLDIWRNDQDASLLDNLFSSSPPTPPLDGSEGFYPMKHIDTGSEVCASESGTCPSSFTSPTDDKNYFSYKSYNPKRSYASSTTSVDTVSWTSSHPHMDDPMPKGVPLSNMAGAALTQAYDNLFTFLGTYFDRLSSLGQLKGTTQTHTNAVVEAGLDFISVVSAILDKSGESHPELEGSKNGLLAHISSLANVGSEVLSIEKFTVRNAMILTTEEAAKLKEYATKCVIGCCDTYAKAQAIFANMNDFCWNGAIEDQPPKNEESSPEEAAPQPTMTMEDMDRLLMAPSAAKSLKQVPSIASLKDTSRLSRPATPSNLSKELPPTPAPEPVEKELPPTPQEQQEVSVVIQKTEENAETTSTEIHSSESSVSLQAPTERNGRSDSVSGSLSSGEESIRSSETDSLSLSRTSTRATTPDVTSAQVSTARASLTVETVYHNELIINKDGGIGGGTLPALVERLTLHNSYPDAVFVGAFYLTFRLFTTPKELATTLVARYDSVSEEAEGAAAVKHRVFNVFKGWLESHWRNETDSEAVDIIREFATEKHVKFNPSGADRLKQMLEKATTSKGPLALRLASSVSSLGQAPVDMPVPVPTFVKGRLSFIGPGTAPASLLDFNAEEIAKQITARESKMFCTIQPEELVAQQWQKKDSPIGRNVRAMCQFSTELSYLVADTILSEENIKKRAEVFKHWIKVAQKCYELSNFDTVMAILCTLNATAISRLKKTTALLPEKYKSMLAELRKSIDVSRNLAVIRAKLREAVPPCLPFVGMYLTDLTFIDVGNPCKRPLSTDNPTSTKVINFDKHLKTARIISEIQRFQIPYRIPEESTFQHWLDEQLARVRAVGASDVQVLYRRSCALEPKDKPAAPPPKLESQNSNGSLREIKSASNLLGFGRH